MIMRSYQQLKNSLEHLEEFWLFLHETIYDKYQHGKLQFDKIWKNLFLEKIIDNHKNIELLIFNKHDIIFETKKFLKTDKN